MKKTFFIKTWEQAKILENPVRKQIISECSTTSLSIQEISKKLGLNPGSTFNHVNKLKAAGFLSVANGRLVNGIQEKKYSRSAESFDYSKIRKGEIAKRDQYIGNSFGKDVMQILKSDLQGNAQRIEVSLSEDHYQIFLIKLNELREFLLKNKQSGDIRTLVLLAAGRLESK